MDIFEKDLSGAMVSPDEPGYDKLISTIFDTMAATAEMNAKGWLTPEETAALKKQYADEVQLAVATAQREPEPDPFREDWNATVWRPY